MWSRTVGEQRFNRRTFWIQGVELGNTTGLFQRRAAAATLGAEGPLK